MDGSSKSSPTPQRSLTARQLRVRQPPRDKYVAQHGTASLDGQ